NPTMAPAHVGAIARRVFLVHLDPREQTAAAVAALHQIVTEDSVVRKTPFQRLLEGIHIVDDLADERTFSEQVLVYVRHGARIRVDARLAAKKARVTRLRGARQARSNSRLQDAVSLADALLLNAVPP